MTKIELTITSFLLILATGCQSQNPPPNASGENINNTVQLSNKLKSNIICGAEQMDRILPLLKNKRVAMLVNQTATVGRVHVVDSLLARGVSIKKIFAPEHGFRGNADAGEFVKDSVDPKTNISIVSLYGQKTMPSSDDLKDIDVLIFDIQDVGTRFYTFISSLHYLMEACAKNNLELIVLDRPNPNGWYVDGPVLKKEFQSFVGLDPVPVVHGLTVGEYAQMVNGEKWLPDGIACKLNVIPCLNYDHTMHYSLPVKPSPNLPNEIAVYNYPSLCFFEGTDVSVGRGTDYPFQMIGSPEIRVRNFSFTPLSKSGAKNPPHLNQVCFGFDLRRADLSQGGINLSYLLNTYFAYSDTSVYFLSSGFFDKLAGTDELRKQIASHKTEIEIKASWQRELKDYKIRRKKYLLYRDFE